MFHPEFLSGINFCILQTVHHLSLPSGITRFLIRKDRQETAAQRKKSPQAKLAGIRFYIKNDRFEEIVLFSGKLRFCKVSSVIESEL